MRASGTFHGQPVPDAEAPFPGRMSPFGSTARQCSRLSRARGAFHRRRPARAPFREPVRRAVPAGRRGQPLRFFIEVRKPRLDLCSLAVAGAFKAERASTVSASGCFREHDNGPLERPDHRKVMGRLPESERKSPFDRGNRRSYAGSGVENTESRHSPRGIAPGGDFAPTPIASSTSCHGHRPLPCLEKRGKRAMPPTLRTLALHAQREGRATPDFREEIRRSPTRGAFCLQAVRDANGRRLSETAEAARRPRPAPFSPPDPARARDARTRADSSAPWTACERRTARYCPKAAAPPRTSAFE